MCHWLFNKDCDIDRQIRLSYADCNALLDDQANSHDRQIDGQGLDYDIEIDGQGLDHDTEIDPPGNNDNAEINSQAKNYHAEAGDYRVSDSCSFHDCGGRFDAYNSEALRTSRLEKGDERIGDS